MWKITADGFGIQYALDFLPDAGLCFCRLFSSYLCSFWLTILTLLPWNVGVLPRLVFPRVLTLNKIMVPEGGEAKEAAAAGGARFLEFLSKHSYKLCTGICLNTHTRFG